MDVTGLPNVSKQSRLTGLFHRLIPNPDLIILIADDDALISPGSDLAGIEVILIM